MPGPRPSSERSGANARLVEKLILGRSSPSDDEPTAYETLETMNGRGSSLTPTEMLKGYFAVEPRLTCRRFAGRRPLAGRDPAPW